jgi:hypothetical protein
MLCLVIGRSSPAGAYAATLARRLIWKLEVVDSKFWVRNLGEE